MLLDSSLGTYYLPKNWLPASVIGHKSFVRFEDVNQPREHYFEKQIFHSHQVAKTQPGLFGFR